MPESADAAEKPERPVSGNRRTPRAWLSVLVLAGCGISLALILPIALHARFAWSYDFTGDYYARVLRWPGVPVTVALLGLMGAIVILGVARREELEASGGELRMAALLLMPLLLLKFALHCSSVNLLREYGMSEAVYQFADRWQDGTYNHVASVFRDTEKILRTYQEDVLDAGRDERHDFTLHLETHPPGFVLLFHGLQEFYEAFPGVRQAVEGVACGSSELLRGTLSLLSQDNPHFRHLMAVGYTATMLCFFGATMVPVLTYALCRSFASRSASLLGAGVSALFPGDYAFNPNLVQLTTPVGLLLCLVGVQAFRRRCFGLGLLFGFGAYLALFFSPSFLALLGMLVLGAGLRACQIVSGTNMAGEGGVGKVVGQGWAALLGIAGGFMLPLVALFFLWDFNLISALGSCLRNHRMVYAELHRGYWPWCAVNIIDTLLSMGSPVALACAAVAGWHGLRAFRQRSLGVATPFFWGVFLGCLALVLSGTTRGEVGRLWLFLFPVVVASVVPGIDEVLSSLSGKARRWAAMRILLPLLVVQGITVIVINTRVDVLGCARLFHYLLNEGAAP